MNRQYPIEWSKQGLLPRALRLAACGVGVVVCVWAFSGAVALAEGINIGGQDASAQMKDVHTLVTTLQNIGFKWVAPLIGGGLSIVGIFQVATRRLGMGLLALGGGGALFAVEKIANSLSHLAGN